MSEYTTILEYLRCFIQPGQVSELRAFGEDGGYSGWFDHMHLESMASAAVELERTAVCRGIYFTPNPVSPDLLSRRPNQIGPSGRCTTDADIIARRWLLVDVDPVRPAGANSTEEERKSAWTVATQVQTAMTAAGFAEPIIGSSGNGWHLSYPVDCANDDESKERFRQILIGLDARCSTGLAKVDAKTFNAARIWKLYGTRARKGPSTGERPHRVAFIASPLREITDQDRKQNTAAIPILLSTWDRQQQSFAALESQRPSTGVSERARAYLAKIPGAISGQDGHGRTYHVAMTLVEGFSLDRDAALSLIRAWNATCQPPWTDRELQHKVDSAVKNAVNRGHLLRDDRPARPDGRAPRYDVRPVYTGPDSVPESQAPEDDPDATADDLVRLQATVQWTWPGWIQRGTLTCLASDPGIGKTRLCADLTRRVWHAEPWPDGAPPTMPPRSRVLWIAADSQWAELGTLPDAFGFPPEAIVLNGRRSNPYVGTNLDSIEDLAEFERRIRRVQPALVFVDTAGNATDRNQGRPEEAKAFFKPLAEIATRNNTSIILVTHLNRGGQVLGNRIVGAVRQVVKLDCPDQTQEDRRRLRVEKTNSQKPPALGVTMGSAGNTYDHDPPTGADEVAPARVVGRPSHLYADMEWVREYLATGAKMVAQTRRDAQASGIGASRLYRARDALQVVEYEVDGRLWWRST
jgi:hypothetical protein